MLISSPSSAACSNLHTRSFSFSTRGGRAGGFRGGTGGAFRGAAAAPPTAAAEPATAPISVSAVVGLAVHLVEAGYLTPVGMSLPAASVAVAPPVPDAADILAAAEAMKPFVLPTWRRGRGQERGQSYD